MTTFARSPLVLAYAVWALVLLLVGGTFPSPVDAAGPRQAASRIATKASDQPSARAGRVVAVKLQRSLPQRFRQRSKVSRVRSDRFSVTVAGRTSCVSWASGSGRVSRGGCFRNPRRQPFSSDSIWNTAIGTGARYVDARLSARPRGDEWAPMPIADVEHIVMRPKAPSTSIFYSPGGWGGDRCSATSQRLASVPIPGDYVVGSSGLNSSAAFLLRDGRTVLQTQPLARCRRDGAATSYVTFPPVDIRGSGATGSHGGSGLSALGGSLRVGELRPRKHAPRHALKVLVDAASELARCGSRETCYRWPATKSDSYAVGHYGSVDGSAPSGLRMGALLALPRGLDLGSLGLETAAGQKIAWTLQNYGAYVVDDTYGAGFGMAVETGPNGSFLEQFRRDYGMSFEARSRDETPWARDVRRLVTRLAVVDNNAPGSVAGGGSRLQPPLPPLR